jgi:hypothetical protein
MATNDPEFYQSPKFTPEPPMALPRQRGCFFYGCIIASVLALLVAILVAIGVYFGLRLLNQAVEEYTGTAPRELPKVEMPPEKRQILMDRVEAFNKAVDGGVPTEPLELTSDDLNALIEENPDLKGKIYVKIEGKEIKGQVSLPLDAFANVPLLGMFKGRYLNGEAAFKASLDDGFLLVRLDSIEVNGKSPPENVMTDLRRQNLAENYLKDPKNAARLRKLESLEVKDGKIILKVRAKAAGSPTTKKEVPDDVPAPASSAATKAEPAKTEPPKAKFEADPAKTPAPKS